MLIPYGNTTKTLYVFVFPILYLNFAHKFGSVAQLNRASDSGSAGHGFESHPSHLNTNQQLCKTKTHSC